MTHSGFSALVGALLTLATAAQAQDLFGRGDADCSEALNAADTIAAVRALAGSTSCANDDCDRDGALTDSDLDCTVTCLFGECLVPANAPTITAVEPDAEAIRPYTTLRVFGHNFSSGRHLKRVTIGGIDADIIDAAVDELLVLVPPIASGVQQLRIHDGDLGGPPFSISVAMQRPIGAFDSLEATLTLLDTALSRFAELDLEGHYGEDTTPVRAALDDFRNDLQDQRETLLSDPSFSPTLRAQLDAAIDSSGVPDRLREILADIDQVLARSDRRPRQGTLVVGTIAKNLGDTAAIARGVLTVGAGGVAAATGIAFGAGVLAGVLTAAASNASVPIVTQIRFFDDRGELVSGPAPRRIVVVNGARLLGTRMVIETGRGRFTVLAENDADTSRQFRLPDDSIGFCGQLNFYLSRSLPIPGESSRFPIAMCPSLTEIVGPNPTAPGAHVKLYSRAMSGCFGTIRFEGDDQVERVPFTGISPTLIDVAVPNLKPDTYALSSQISYCTSNTIPGLLVKDTVTGVDIECSPTGPEPHSTTLEAPPGLPNRINCSASTVPSNATAPPGSRIEWSSSDPRTANIVGSNTGATVTVSANQPGTTAIKAALIVGDRTIADSGALSQEVIVKDSGAPTVTLTSTSPTQIPAGGTVSLHVNASDNIVVSRLHLIASGPVSNGDQELPCLDLEKSCAGDFTVNVAPSATGGAIGITAEAFDGFGNKGTSSTLSFTVTSAPDTTCPEVYIESPAANGVVNAGTTGAVMAHAADEVGVKRFRYSANGDALVSQVRQELPFPAALMTADLRFNFTVKGVAALTNVANRIITINVEAFDEAGNSCGAQTETVSVGGLWEDCDGSISADKPIGHIGELVTLTAIVAGPLATRVNEIVGHNPGGTFDLMPRGNGTFTLALTYQGIGKFKFGFTALDHGDPVCEGAIVLESIAP